MYNGTMKAYTVEPLEVWLMKLKGKERPFEEYPRSVRRTLTRVKQLGFDATTVIRFNSKLRYTFGLDALSARIATWLSANASGRYVRTSDGQRFYLEHASDAAWFKLVFIDEEQL